MKNETLSQAVRRLSIAIEQEPNNAKLYFERGMAYFDHENWFNAEDDFSKVLELEPNNIDSLLQRGISCFNQKNWDNAIVDFQELVLCVNDDEDRKNYQSWLRKAYSEKQQTETLEERMLPYAEMVEKLKAEFQKRGKSFTSLGQFLGLKSPKEYAELMAYMALSEEYELLGHFLEADPDPEEKFDMLNVSVRPQFASWEPSPLYFITAKKQREKMKDPCKMMRFLKAHGADVNLVAGDGSTPLWNQTYNSGSIQILQTLLELGANPNQISEDREYEWAPLPFCLMPDFIDDDGDNWEPIEALSVEKAKLLLQYGADPNLVCPSVADLSALTLTIKYGFPKEREDDEPLSSEMLDFIEFLLKSGADPNFIDSEGNTPLSHATDNNLFEVGQLLLLYGAEMPDEEEKDDDDQTPKLIVFLKATEDCFFRPGAGNPWKRSTFFNITKVVESKILRTENYIITIKEITNEFFKGKITFSSQGLTLDAGEFCFDSKNQSYSSEYLNIAYDTHMRLCLEWATDPEEYVPVIRELTNFEREFLSDIPEKIVTDYCRFCLKTPMGESLRYGSDKPIHSLLMYFGVLMKPFEGLLFPKKKFDSVISEIEKLDFRNISSLDEEKSGSRYYAYNRLLVAVVADFSNTNEESSLNKIYDKYVDAEMLFRQNMIYGDIIFLGVCACLYRTADIEYMVDSDQYEAHFRECMVTYANLSQRDDLFTEDQQKVLTMLNQLIFKLTKLYNTE